MKFVSIAIITFIITTALPAQILFKTASDDNGIVKPYASGFNLGYDFSGDDALLNYSIAKEETLIDKDANITGSRFTASNIRLSIPVEKNKHVIMKKNTFTPAVGIAWQHIWNNNQLTQTTRYNFISASFDMSENSFGTIDKATDSISIEDKVSTAFTIIPGCNWLMSSRNDRDDVIIGLSIPIRYKTNPTDDLNTKEYIIDYQTGANGVIQKSEEAYSSTLDNYFSITPKIDFIYTPFLTTDDGEETGPRFGILSSFAARINITDSKVRNSFSIGPSMHPQYNASAVIATIQAEFSDFTDVDGTKSFEDVFSVRFYVGLPLQKKD